MIPLPTSSVMPIAGDAGGEHDGLGEDAGHQELVVRAGASSREGDRAAEDDGEEQHEHDRLEDREDRQLRDARDALEVAPGDDEPVAERACRVMRMPLLRRLSSTEAWPVRARKTSSRVGRRRPMSSIAIAGLAELADIARASRAASRGDGHAPVCSSSWARRRCPSRSGSPRRGRSRPVADDDLDALAADLRLELVGGAPGR